jgi:uncharacterized protein YcaQ
MRGRMPARRRPVERLTAAQARRVALAAQGFADPRPTGEPGGWAVRRLIDRVGLVQIDSVNVVVRSHELPLFSRLGAHPRDTLVGLSWRGEVFEYWGHEASFIPVEHHPLLRHKMAAAQRGAAYNGLVRLAKEKPAFVDDVLAEVVARGPLAAGELSMGAGRKGPWWGWNDAKMAVEYLFWCGHIAARRRPNFEREYALPERIIPAAILALPTPDERDARRELLALAARSLGVATAKDLADYYRLNVVKARPLLAELVEDGRLVPARVEGWREQAYLSPGARAPRRVDARAVLSPFDSLVWERSRSERLFDFHYRLELYTPAPKRRFGYYVLPFLLGERIVARVDVKADRQAGVLRVPAVFAEDHADPKEVTAAMAAELVELATWLGLSGVAAGERGDLAEPLAAALADV